ncbi:N-acetyltransferase [Nocardioides phosphati]|uniref:N-acetyltransferase n=1 Tax=Nocardioides phosphati TaxID=1867775 RepID=A0ABQ2N851_9ACTN|nr:GNAT family N-acetyltransferase [Nocardioides phosphati]GGO86793.1 N-acetyltransferase [Nocardioides phosphati]
MDFSVRVATANDAGACAGIYGPYVEDTVVSFETEAPTPEQMAARIGSAIRWLVAVDADDTVIGYAYASSHRERAAYRFACDVSVYVRPGNAGRGVGRALYEALLADVEQQGYRMACAGIALPNPASVGLHTALGFRPVGTYERIGWKRGAWHDVHWMQRPLGGDGPPLGEPRPA